MSTAENRESTQQTGVKAFKAISFLLGFFGALDQLGSFR